MSVSRFRGNIVTFLETEEVANLIFYFDGKDLAAVNKPPTKFKKTKCVYFAKLKPERIASDNIHELVGFSAGPQSTVCKQQTCGPSHMIRFVLGADDIVHAGACR